MRSLAFYILPLTEQVMHLNAFEASSSAMGRHTGTHRDTPRHTETHRDTPRHTATHRNLPFRPASHILLFFCAHKDGEDHAPTCAMLEHAAEDCG